MTRLSTPRYVNDDDIEAEKEVKISCTTGCNNWFVVRPDKDRKERIDGADLLTFYLCPCGAERIVSIRARPGKPQNTQLCQMQECHKVAVGCFCYDANGYENRKCAWMCADCANCFAI